jgi:hypothetical protein
MRLADGPAPGRSGAELAAQRPRAEESLARRYAEIGNPSFRLGPLKAERDRVDALRWVASRYGELAKGAARKLTIGELAESVNAAWQVETGYAPRSQ